jgi:hypothetical protein
MEPKLDGTPPYKLDGISWRRPGVLEVQISIYALSKGFTMPATPKIADYVDFTGIVPVMEVRRVRNEGVATRVEWVFRAGKEMPDSPTDRQESDKKSQWSMEVSLMQLPITVHPNLKQIMEVGGGVFKDGEVDFPRMLNGAKNPYYGTSEFLVPGVTMTRQLIEVGSVMSFPQIDKLGYSRRDRVVQNPEGQLGADIAFKFVGNSNQEGRLPWLLVDHSVRRAGSEQYESKTWRYGGVVGWPDPIYDADYSFTAPTPAGNPARTPIGAV